MLPLSQTFKTLRSCLCCGGESLHPYLNLGQQPPCNWLHDGSAMQAPQVFPLETVVCTQCFHSQLTIAVDPKILFSNYTYRTGVSRTLVDHYSKLARSASDVYLSINPSRPYIAYQGESLNAIDIGCNDGTLLHALGLMGWYRIGVDPCEVSEVKNNTDQFFESPWNAELRYNKDFTSVKADLITATNVLAHNDNPKEFLRNVAYKLESDGIFVVEFPYARDMIKHCEFDTIYHEHISYFNANSFRHLCKNTGLYVYQVNELGVHGGSLNFVLRPCQAGHEDGLHCEKLWDLIENECQIGLLNLATYNEFQKKVDSLSNWLRTTVNQSVEEGRSVIGFGASGKSTVVLNYTKVKPERIIDQTPSKIGKLSPGLDIPIFPLESLRSMTGYYDVVILAWNCYDECCVKIQMNMHPDAKVRVIRYAPSPEVNDLPHIKGWKTPAE